MNVRDTATELGFHAGWRLVRMLPEPAAAALFRRGADRAVRKDGRGVRRLRANLARVAPDADLDALVIAGMRSYARYWMEAFRLPSWSHAEIGRRFEIRVGEDALRAALAAGTGAVLALPHTGNWDLAGAWGSINDLPITTVAERLKPEGLYQRFLDYRVGLGMEILPLTGGTAPPLVELTKALAANRMAVLLADRDLSSRGIPVRFFDGVTKMPAGPAVLALRTGAPLFAVSMFNEPDKTVAMVEGPLPVPSDGSFAERTAVLTQAVADVFAAGIAAHPADWHMLQRIWVSEPAAEPLDSAPVPADG